MDSLVLSMQLPIVALTKARWKPFCSCPFDEAVPCSLRCEIMPLLDLWAFLSVINISEASSLGALCPPTLALTTVLQPLVKVWMSLWDNQWLMEFHSFQRDVYSNSALTRRTAGILSPAVSDFNVWRPRQKSPRPARRWSTPQQTVDFVAWSAQEQTATNQCATYELSLSITDNEWFWHHEGQVHQFAATLVVLTSPSHRFAFHRFQDPALVAPWPQKLTWALMSDERVDM